MGGAAAIDASGSAALTLWRALEVTECDVVAARPARRHAARHRYADLRRDEDGRARVRLATPDGERRVTSWLDERYAYLMPSPSTRCPSRRALGVEPMTCASNALQSGEGLQFLERGKSLTRAWGIAPG